MTEPGDFKRNCSAMYVLDAVEEFVSLQHGCHFIKSLHTVC